VTRGDWTTPGLWLSMLGLIVAGVLLAKRIRGALLVAIFGVTLVAILTGAPVYPGETAFAGFESGIFGFVWPGDLIGAMDIGAALEGGIIAVILTFLLVD